VTSLYHIYDKNVDIAEIPQGWKESLAGGATKHINIKLFDTR